MKRFTRQGFAALLSLLLACQFFPTALATSPDVSISEDVFPDAVFRQWLTDPANPNGAGADGVFTQEELEDIRQINVSSMGISSLEGIEVFSALESLSCKDNALEALNVQQNRALRYLRCDYNRIDSLDVSGLDQLQALYCENNHITEAVLNLWRGDHQSILALVDNGTVLESNAQELWTAARGADEALNADFVANRTDLTISADQTLVAQTARAAAQDQLSGLSRLADAAAWAKELGGLSLRPMAEVTSQTVSAYTDTEDGAWYESAISWATDAGILTGYADDSIRPNAFITRQQLAAMLYRYARYTGRDVSLRADLAGYADAAQISPYALEAMQWANAAGIINGSGEALLPGNTATRAQTAAMLNRFCTVEA